MCFHDIIRLIFQWSKTAFSLKQLLVFSLCFPLLVNISNASDVKLTQEEQHWITQHPQVILGGEADWAPFDFVNKDGKYSGIANDYLALIAQKTGLNFTVSIDEWSNLLDKIKEQKIDILGAAFYTDERTQFVNYSTPYLDVLDYFFIRSDLAVKTLESLNGKRVAIPKKDARIDIIKKHFPKIKIVTVANFSSAIDAVLENRADMLFDSYSIISYALKKDAVNTIIPFKSSRHLGTNPVHIITRKGVPELSSIIQKGLNAITENERQTIYNRWIGHPPKTSSELVKLTLKEQTWLAKHPSVSVGGSPDWTPFNFTNEKGEYSGIANDYLQLIGEKTGLSFNISIAPWSINLQKTKDNKLDLLGAVYHSKERNDYLNFSSPYFEVLDFFFIREGLAAKTLDDLNGMRVAIPEGYAHIQFIQKHFPKIKIVLVKTFSEAIDAVLEKRAELLYDTYGSLMYTFSKKGINTINPFKSTGYLGKKYIHIATSKALPELATIIQKGLNAISEEEKSTISKKWLGIQESSSSLIQLSPAETRWLKKHPIIRFTGDPNWLPYEAFDEQGVYKGIVADHLKIIEQRLGIKLTIIPTKTWSESIEKLKGGEVDIFSETTDSPLESILSFTQSYINSPVVIVMQKDSGYIDSVGQIKNKKIAVIKNYGYLPKIFKKYPNLQFQNVLSIQDGLTAVSTGKVDALLATLAQASYHIAEQGMNNIRIVGKTEFNTQLAFGMREGFEPLVPLFNRALQSIPSIEKQVILNRWGKQKFVNQIDYQLISQIVAAFLATILFILYWNRKLSKEVKLRKVAEQQTQTLINQIPLQVVLTAYDGKILYVNPQALNDYSIPKEDVSKYYIHKFYNNIDDLSAINVEIKEKGLVEQKIVPMRKLNGDVYPMMLSITPITYHDSPALLSIGVDMTQRIELEETLEEAKRYAEAASHAKSDFLANMSHEIRTPMNAILGFTELLNEQVKEPHLKSFLKTIQSAGNNLLVLINDILDLSKIEAGKLDIKKQPCDPSKLIHELSDIFRLKLSEKNINLIINIDPQIPQSLHLDEARLRQVLLNLVGNAIKFTEKGTIQIIVTSDNEGEIRSQIDLLIKVKDSGIGISEEHQQLIFQQFEQSSNQNTRKYGGTGLGLSISKRLVEMMGGKLSLTSQEGFGSTFITRLKGVDIAALTTTVENEIELETEQKQDISFLPASILVVDDVKDNRQLLIASFKESKLQLTPAQNGLEAVTLAKQQRFDLILMDIRMPIMDGYEASEKIKQFSNVPIIALTASVMDDEFEKSKSEHFDGYLRKPVLKSDLVELLSTFLAFDSLGLNDNHKDEPEFSEAEYKVLPFALEKLEQLLKQNKKVSEHNDLSEITLFADSIIKITDRYPLTVIQKYAQQLIDQVAVFDIAAIKRTLNNYPNVLATLKNKKVDKPWENLVIPTEETEPIPKS